MDGLEPSKGQRRGMTLIEALVIVVIIGILVALLLPAVQGAREAARRARCMSQLRQIGLALHRYHGSVGCLPPGRLYSGDARYLTSGLWCSGPADRSFLVAILPFVEQTSLYNAINHDLTILGTENRTVHSVTVGLFACPSDPGSSDPRAGSPEERLFGIKRSGPSMVASTSYAGFLASDSVASPNPNHDCFRDPTMTAKANGCITDVGPITFGSITDGLSCTILITERAATSLREAEGHRSPPSRDDSGWWFSGQVGDTLLLGCYPPNPFRFAHSSNDAAWAYSASSLHPGGLNVVMSDGSVRFLSETIQSAALEPLTGAPITGAEPGVWQRLISRNGGEIIAGGDY